MENQAQANLVSVSVAPSSMESFPISPDSSTSPESSPLIDTSIPSSPTTSTAVRLNPEQTVALDALLEFLADPDPASPFFVLSGFAGTGKTFLMREVIARAKGSYIQFAFTAPTNKAAKVLRKITGSAGTIYSLLGLRIEKNGELKELVGGKSAIDLSAIDVVFLDEAGMVNSKLFKEIEETAKIFKLRFVLMGDKAQIPPVGEEESPTWKLPMGATLTKVMRHDNQILKLVTSIRGQVGSLTPSINVKSDNDSQEGVWKFTKPAFKASIFARAEAGEFADGEKTKVIAWRNARVAEYNDLIRRAIFGAAAVQGGFLPGDRIIATAPCKRGEDTILGTDDEAIVESVIVTTHPMHPQYRCFELKCLTEANETIRLLVLHPMSEMEFNRDCENLAHKARGNSRLWKAFWSLKDIFHEIKYAYAITAHRSQGSTYENVYVDYQDILLNRNRKEAFQCLYVACSRPTKCLLLA